MEPIEPSVAAGEHRILNVFVARREPERTTFVSRLQHSAARQLRQPATLQHTRASDTRQAQRTSPRAAEAAGERHKPPAPGTSRSDGAIPQSCTGL